MFFGTTFSDYPDDIARALKRADAYWYINRIQGTFLIKSRNSKAALTEDEKHRIVTYLELRDFPMKVMFNDRPVEGSLSR